MASPLENALRLVRPGEMVVPVSDILDKLGSKLTATEKEQLLIAILSRRTDQVKPGDLITAGLLNQLLADVADLEVRLAKVETQQPDAGPAVKISRILPSDDLTVGDEVAIEGRNFEYTLGASYTTFGNKPVFAFEAGSRDDRLIVAVPDPGGLPKEGKKILLTVANRTSSDSRIVTVRPAEAPLYGYVLVVPETIDPNPPKTATDTFFPHSITSKASQEATFSISVSLADKGEALSKTKYDTLVTVLDKNKNPLLNRAVKLAPNATELIFIKVSKLPFTADFNILVKASAPGVQSGESGEKSYKVGAEDPNDDLLTLETPAYEPPTAVADGVLKTKSTVKANMTLTLSEKAILAGMTSCNCDFELKLTDGSGWTLALLAPTADQGTLTTASNVALTKDAPLIVEVAIQAKPNSSPSGRMTLTITRRGQTAGANKVKTFPLTLEVASQ